MKTLGWLTAAVAALLLSACAGAPADSKRPAATPPAPEARPPTMPAAPVDSCGAAEAQALIGKPRSAIPVPVRPELQRVVCTTCAMTLDFNPRRLNFLYDLSTGLIKEARCG